MGIEFLTPVWFLKSGKRVVGKLTIFPDEILSVYEDSIVSEDNQFEEKVVVIEYLKEGTLFKTFVIDSYEEVLEKLKSIIYGF